MSAHVINEKKRTSDISSNVECDFESLLLSERVLDGLKKCGFVQPSPIQMEAIPLAKCGVDMVCQAKSGTGKTCVFAVCALETVDVQMRVTQVLVLAPTREIAHQIHGVVSSIGCCFEGLHCGLFIGGISMKQDVESIKYCHVAIGTPGRVRHLIEKGCLVTSSIRLFVLDEADKLLEKGSFEEQINWIYSTLSRHKQVLALSATYPEELATHLNNYMQDAIHVRINSTDVALKGVMQYYMEVKYLHLPNKLFDLKCRTLIATIRKLPFQQCMVFSNYHSRAERLCQALNKEGWPSTFIAGSQVQADRLKAITNLKEYNCRILITTDLTSRGIDCDRVNLVINLDLPWDMDTYFHRVGRAGRFGSYGMAISIVSTGEEKERLKNLEASMEKKIHPLPADSETLLGLWSSVTEPDTTNQDVGVPAEKAYVESSGTFASDVVVENCEEDKHPNIQNIPKNEHVSTGNSYFIKISESPPSGDEIERSCEDIDLTAHCVSGKERSHRQLSVGNNESDDFEMAQVPSTDENIIPIENCSFEEKSTATMVYHCGVDAGASSFNSKDLPKYLKLFDRRKKRNNSPNIMRKAKENENVNNCGNEKIFPAVASQDEHVVSQDEQVALQDKHSLSEDKQVGSLDEHALSEDKQVGSLDEHALSEDKQVGSLDEHALSEDKQVGSLDEHALSEDKQVGSQDEHALSEDKQVASQDEHDVSHGVRAVSLQQHNEQNDETLENQIDSVNGSSRDDKVGFKNEKLSFAENNLFGMKAARCEPIKDRCTSSETTSKDRNNKLYKRRIRKKETFDSSATRFSANLTKETGEHSSSNFTIHTGTASSDRLWNQNYFVDKYYQAYYDHIRMINNYRLFCGIP